MLLVLEYHEDRKFSQYTGGMMEHPDLHSCRNVPLTHHKLAIFCGGQRQRALPIHTVRSPSRNEGVCEWLGVQFLWTDASGLQVGSKLTIKSLKIRRFLNFLNVHFLNVNGNDCFGFWTTSARIIIYRRTASFKTFTLLKCLNHRNVIKIVCKCQSFFTPSFFRSWDDKSRFDMTVIHIFVFSMKVYIMNKSFSGTKNLQVLQTKGMG